MSIKESWLQIESWLAEHAPGHLLAPGASPDELARAEAILNLRFPDDLRESYLIHNGSRDMVLFEHGVLLPLFTDESSRHRASIVDIWQWWRDNLDQVPAEHWDVSWIPIVGHEADYYVVDTQPVDRGPSGQILFSWHEVDEVADIAPSFHDLLESRAMSLKSGGYSFDAEAWIPGICHPNENGVIARSRFRPRHCRLT